MCHVAINFCFFAHIYSAPVGVQSIVIKPSVCLSVCLYVREHISGTTLLIFAKFYVQIPCCRGSVLLWQHCATLCTSGFTDDITFGCSGTYGHTWT